MKIRLEGIITEDNFIEELMATLEDCLLLGSNEMEATWYDPIEDVCYDVFFYDDWGYETQMVRDLKANKEVTLEGRQPDASDMRLLCYEYGYEMEE